jgi:hypothetical protein
MANRSKNGDEKIVRWVMFVKVALFPAKEPERVSIELSYPEIPSKAA